MMPAFAWSKGDPTSSEFQRKAEASEGASVPMAVPESGRADDSAGRPPQLTARPSNDPPTVSVAEVRTTVDSANSRERSNPPTESGAIRTERRTDPRNSSEDSQTTSLRLAGSGSSKAVRIRTALSWTSSTDESAALRAAAASGSAAAIPGLAGPIAVRSDQAASRIAASAGAAPRPGGLPSDLGAIPRGVQPTPLAGSFEAIGILLFGDLAATPGRGTDRGGSEIGRGDAGDAVDQLVGLVDHHDVVVRQDLDAGDGVDREQCVVGDHYVGLRRLDSGALGEAVLTDRALVLTDAFAGGDTDLPPRLIGYARHQFVPITGFGV